MHADKKKLLYEFWASDNGDVKDRHFVTEAVV